MAEKEKVEPVLTRFRDSMSAPWVLRHFRDLTDDEKQLVANSLGGIPHDHNSSSIGELWDRVQRDDVGMFTLPGPDGKPQAATFFQIDRLADGSLQFESLATTAIAHSGRRLAITDLPIMEKVAREAGCASISMQTIRPALVALLTEFHGWFVAGVILRKKLS